MKKLFLILAALLTSNEARGQNPLETYCAPLSNTQCARMAEAAQLTQVRTGIALSGGNPVPGASSTLGMRLGAIPRITAAARFTVTQLDAPDLFRTSEMSGMPRSLNLDAAVGVFSGLSLLPTIGGFGSIDVLATYGRLTLPDDYLQENVNSWGVGVRLGILRESFTAPGISLSGMYRKIGDVQMGSGIGPADGPGTFYVVGDASVLSGRATIGKRILMLGAVAGLGYDRYSATATIQNQDQFNHTTDDFTNSRTTAFANLSWTMLILHIVGEGGIQRGGEENAYYGSLAVRLAL
jgi:hypothetical protein